MGYNRRIEASSSEGKVSRRVFLQGFCKYGSLAVASTVAGGLLEAVAAPKKDLKSYRRRLFGWMPFIKDGLAEKLDYDLYFKDEEEAWRITKEVVEHLGRNKEDKEELWKKYRAYYGAINKARHEWEKDRKKAVFALLKGINIPDYDIHRMARTALREEGTLDFEKHKKTLERHLRKLEEYAKYGLDEVAGWALDIDKSEFVSDSAKGLEAFYIATLPIHSKSQYNRVEEMIEEVKKDAFEAFETALNVGDGIIRGDPVKTAHQTGELMGYFRKLFPKMIEIEKTVLHETERVHADNEKKIYIHSQEKMVRVYDFIAEEWEQLSFQSWRKELLDEFG